MTPKVGDIIGGVVQELTENGANISLPDGSCGFLHLSEMDGSPERGTQKVDAGQELLVKVVGLDRNGRPALSLRRLSSEDREMAEFHDEVVQMHSALAERSPAMASQDPQPDDEERIEQRLERWLAEAKAVLALLEKRRAKRLAERVQSD